MNAGSDVEVADVEGVELDELAPGFDQIAHQRREQAVGLEGVLDPHLEQGSTSGSIVVSQSCSGFISPRPL
jgi:hypothetical protein